MSTNDQPDDAEQRLADAVLAAVEQYQRDRRAEQAATDTDHDDPLTRDYLRWMANRHPRYSRKGGAEFGRFLDQLAADLTLDDVRVIRLAAEAAAAATPRAIRAARARGMEPPQIAAELGLTPSRVYQVLRDQAAENDQP
ncbi:hypothetical protein [Streptomyces chryseus]